MESPHKRARIEVKLALRNVHPRRVRDKLWPNHVVSGGTITFGIKDEAKRTLQGQEKDVYLLSHPQLTESTPEELFALSAVVDRARQSTSATDSVPSFTSSPTDLSLAPPSEDQHSFQSNGTRYDQGEQNADETQRTVTAPSSSSASTSHTLTQQPQPRHPLFSLLSPQTQADMAHLFQDQEEEVLIDNEDAYEACEDLVEDEAQAPDIDYGPDDPTKSHGYEYEPVATQVLNCTRKTAGHQNNVAAAMKVESVHQTPTALSLFLQFLPVNYLQEVVLEATNDELRAKDARELTMGELFRWIGLLMVIAMHAQSRRDDFWSTKMRTITFHPPYLGDLMSRDRFKQIVSALRLDFQANQPDYDDRMWEIRPLYDAFNRRMREVFRPSSTLCLDESMLSWTNNTCPRWVLVSHKPNPRGNEIHTLACAQTRVIMAAEVVETSKDRPPELGPQRHETELKSKIAALVKRMTEHLEPGRIVNMDSGFGYIKGMEVLESLGLYGTIIIKKRRYWPAGSLGGFFKERLQHAAPGTTLIKKFKHHNFYLMGYREAKFISISAHNFGTTAQTNRVRIRYDDNKNLVRLRYPLPLHDYYGARHVVNDNNNYRMSAMSVEAGLNTRSWTKRHLSCVLAICEVNACLMYKYYSERPGFQTKTPALSREEFRAQLAHDLIHNEWPLDNRSSCRFPQMSASQGSEPIQHIPVKVGLYLGKWDEVNACYKRCKQKYQKSLCRGTNCSKYTRVVCKCQPGLYLCPGCFSKHVDEMAQEAS